MREPPPFAPGPARRPWYELWFVPGAIAFLGGLVILGLEAWFRSRGTGLLIIGPVSLLISLALFSLGWTLDLHRRKLGERIRESTEGLGQVVRSDIARIASGMEQPYLLQLREQLLLRARQTLKQLEDPGRALPTVEQCTEDLIRAIRSLDERKRQEILAVCGQKAWDSPEVQEYYQANYEKALKGVRVRRIFIQESGKEFSRGERTVLRDHLDREHENVQGRVIFGEDVRHLEDYRFPPGFGFAILGQTVVVHWGLSKHMPEAGRSFSDPWYADYHRRLFERLWKRAKGETEAERRRIHREILEET